MDEQKEQFFNAVMFAIGPPPVDTTRLGSMVGSKGAPAPARQIQRELFKARMISLMKPLNVQPFRYWASADDMLDAYFRWYESQKQISRAARQL